MKPFLPLAGCILLILTIIGCSPPVDYTFGFSAEETGRFWILTAKFDNSLHVPAGNVGCCLASGGASAIMNPKRYPKTGYFEWMDESTNTYYRATLQYPDNTKEIADNLDPLVRYKDGSTYPKSVFFITSITSDNQAISWVSNSIRNSDALIKRDIIELDRSQGEAFVPDFVIERQQQKTHDILNSLKKETNIIQ